MKKKGMSYKKGKKMEYGKGKKKMSYGKGKKKMKGYKK